MIDAIKSLQFLSIEFRNCSDYIEELKCFVEALRNKAKYPVRFVCDGLPPELELEIRQFPVTNKQQESGDD